MASFKTDILKLTEIDELLSLQRENLVQNISETTASSQGFLTFQYSEKSIEEMMRDMPQPVTRSTNEMVGYALATSSQVGGRMELLMPLLNLVQSLEFNDKLLAEQKFYILGQVCVKEGWRGAGVFDALYKKHRELFENAYDCVVTEIAVANERSQAAHARVGFQTIHQYFENNRHWNVVAWNWK